MCEPLCVLSRDVTLCLCFATVLGANPLWQRTTKWNIIQLHGGMDGWLLYGSCDVIYYLQVLIPSGKLSQSPTQQPATDSKCSPTIT